jgi:hypothetical protein
MGSGVERHHVSGGDATLVALSTSLATAELGCPDAGSDKRHPLDGPRPFGRRRRGYGKARHSGSQETMDKAHG